MWKPEGGSILHHLSNGRQVSHPGGRLAGIATAAQGTAEYVSMAYWRIGYPDAGYLDAGTHCCEVEQSGSSPGLISHRSAVRIRPSLLSKVPVK